MVRLSCGVQCTSGVLFGLNLLFLLLGLTVMGLGIYIRVDESFSSVAEIYSISEALGHDTMRWVGITMIVVGVFSSILAAFGCLGKKAMSDGKSSHHWFSCFFFRSSSSSSRIPLRLCYDLEFDRHPGIRRSDRHLGLSTQLADFLRIRISGGVQPRLPSEQYRSDQNYRESGTSIWMLWCEQPSRLCGCQCTNPYVLLCEAIPIQSSLHAGMCLCSD